MVVDFLDVVVVVVTNKQSMYLQHFVYLATKRLLFQSYSHRPQSKGLKNEKSVVFMGPNEKWKV